MFWQISPQSSRLILAPYLNWDKLRVRKIIFSGVSFLCLALVCILMQWNIFIFHYFLAVQFIIDHIPSFLGYFKDKRVLNVLLSSRDTRTLR